MLSDSQKKSLLKLARDVIQARLQHSTYQNPDDPIFAQQCGIFVTLHKGGKLRGCIGYIQAYKSMLDSVKEMAIAAAFRDPRFPPLQVDELADLRIEISVLSPLKLVRDISEITIGRDGLYLQHPYSSGLLLPQVATEWAWDRDTFLEQVCHKAGLPENAWQDDKAELYRFSAEVFQEEG